MPVIDVDKCVGCKTCQTYCSDDAIEFKDKKCRIDPELCTECYVCLRMQVCEEGAIHEEAFNDFYKQLQHVLSDPVETHSVTGVTGRGTEEVKTNDVSGRYRKGEVGLSIDMGRPGMGVYLRDAEKVAMAAAAAGFELAPPEDTPLAAVMTDLVTGKLMDECLNYRLLSVIVEGKCKEKKVNDVLKALQTVAKDIDTVFSLGLISRVDENGHCKALESLGDLDLPQPHRGKVNVGLGYPIAEA